VGIEDLLRDALSEEARAASEQMADIEFEDEVQTRLPEDLRYGGLYGLMSYLGMQGQGDQEGINRPTCCNQAYGHALSRPAATDGYYFRPVFSSRSR
jgi:hypothetical protein